MHTRSRLPVATVLVAVLSAAGCRHGANSADAAQGQFPWAGNRLGITDQVPAPWTALKLDGSVVEYWGGRIDFTDSSLPRQFTSRGVELLSRPVALNVRAGGQPVAFGAASVQPGSVTPASVMLITTASAPKLDLRCENTVEFDGMVRIHLAVTAKEAVRLESATLEVPLRPEAAELYRRFYIYDFDAMKVDREDLARAGGAVQSGWEIPFCPYVWIGAPEAGLEWFCESDRDWRPWGASTALALARTPKEVVLQARMVTQPQPLKRGDTWRVTFGLSPTPNRPRIPNWRSYRWGGRMDGPRTEVDTATHRLFAIFWINEPGGLSLAYPGMPWPEDPTAFATARAELARRKILYVPYGSLFKIDTTIPEWAVYGTEWSGGRTLSGWRSRRGESEGSSVDIAVPSYQDFLVYTYSEMVRQHGIDGLYFDFGAPGLNPINPARPEGRLADQGIYYAPLFALRDLYKRLYVATEGQKPGFLTIVHGMLPAMCGSFVDANVQGEGLQDLFNTSGLAAGQAARQMAGQRWYTPDYIDALPPEWYVAEWARDVAEFALLIPEITKQNKPYFQAHPEEEEAYTRGMIAVAALCDIHAIWLTNADNQTLQQYSAGVARFAPLNDDCTYHPFWKSPVRLEPSTPGVYATLYTLPDRALLVLSNLGKAPATLTVDPCLASMGVKPTRGAATDPMTNAPLPLTADGKVSVTVPAKDFALILLD
jgi:hypothetical protein